ncbi:hypothetical protein BY996DRAFT_6430933 [Phakopsora pachyrhizi]|nr:hypothetical protein BY996DRAFT_6430933 [Phakopsora pachyrhizi]
MGVTDFAASLNVSNFICGIGGNCHAGQPCYPLGTLDWYILFAIQQWNTHLNIYYDAVEYSISMVQTSMNALIASLFPASDTTAIRNMKSDMGIQASLTLVTGTVLMDVMMFFGLAGGAWSVFFNQLNFWMGAGMGYLAFSIKEPPGPLKDGFDQATFYLTNYKEAIQQKVSDESKKRLAAGISTKEGIYEILKGGEYFEPAKTAPLPQIEASLKKITLALSINMLLNQINAFITVGQNKKSCRDKGKNGAWGSPHTLSWCDHYGGTKVVKTFNEINNANSIEESFDFSTETIVKSSMACQALNKGYRYTPWDKDQGELPKKADDVCVFNLPVCYLKDRVAKKIRRKTRTVEACRKYGGLPI